MSKGSVPKCWEKEQRRGRYEEHARWHRFAIEYPATAQDAWSSAHDNTCYSAASRSSAVVSMTSTTLLHDTDYDDASQYDSMCSQAATVTSLAFSHNLTAESLAAGPSFSWEHDAVGQPRHSTLTLAAARLHAPSQPRMAHSGLSKSRHQHHPYRRPAEEDTAKSADAPLRNRSLPVVGFQDLWSITCVSDQRANSTCGPSADKMDECDDCEWTLGPGKPTCTRPATVAYAARYTAP